MFCYQHISSGSPSTVILLVKLIPLMSVVLILSNEGVDLSVARIEHEKDSE
jgi:hypothetical protein